MENIHCLIQKTIYQGIKDKEMKNRKKTIKWIIVIFLLIAIVFIVLPHFLLNWNDLPETYFDRMVILYYSFSILGAIGTCAAVFIALFSEEIKMWLYKPNISIRFKDDDGFSEKIDDLQQTPVAELYRCFLELEDEGFVNATNCNFNLIEVKYGKSKEKAKSIKHWTGPKKVNQYPFDISVDYPYEIRLFSINNPDYYGTPSDFSQSPLLSIYGIYLDDKYRQKGYWEILYCLSMRNGTSIKVNVAVEWDGVFTSRKTEMKEHLKITKL